MAILNWAFIRQVGPLRWTLRYSVLLFRKRVLKIDSRLRLPTGMELILPTTSPSATEVYVTNANIDWGAEAVFARFAELHRDFLDIGSHIGYYASYLSPCVRQVYAFEPNPRVLPALHANASRANNIAVIAAAVSSSEGAADFYAGGNSATGSLNPHGGISERVVTTTVDAFVALHPGADIGLIKTDVEGHDLNALLGAENTLANHQPLVLTECDYSPELLHLCRRHGYGVFAFLRDKEALTTRFQELISHNVERHAYKMLFLVPSRLDAEFRKLSSRVLNPV